MGSGNPLSPSYWWREFGRCRGDPVRREPMVSDKEILEEIANVVQKIVPAEVGSFPHSDNLTRMALAELAAYRRSFLLIKRAIAAYLERRNGLSRNGRVSGDRGGVAEESIHLEDDPVCYSPADEGLFFDALDRLDSFSRVECTFPGLTVFYHPPMAEEDLKTIVALLKRFRMKIPSSLKPFEQYFRSFGPEEVARALQGAAKRRRTPGD